LLIVGGANTLRTGVLLVVPVPPWVEVIAPVVLGAFPATVPVTLTLIVHVALCATLPPAKLISAEPAVAVTVPPQVFDTAGVWDTTSVPVVDGKVSLKATPVRSPAAVVFGFVIVKLTVVVPFNATVAAPNDLLIVGGATTVSVAFDVFPFPPFVELTCTLLFFVPAVVPCTVADTAHCEFGPIEPPLKLTEDEPATAVAVPPQLLLRFGVEATTKPAGNVSVKATPFSVRF
jgi:hypothetical protein